jgi:hypothetical protein
MKTDAKMVVVWGDQNILSSSIQYLLAGKDDWKVVSVSSLEEFKSLIIPRENDLSDIVIIHQESLDEACLLPLQLLQDHSDLRVITISLENNVMNIYNKQSLLVKEASDLITVIETEAQPQEVIIHSSWR